MRRFFTDEKYSDFKNLKNKGFTGVIFEYGENIEEKILLAATSGLEIWILLSRKESIPFSHLLNIGGRMSIEEENVYAVMPELIGEYLSKLDECAEKVTGVIIPLPDVRGIIWSDSLEDECERLEIDKNECLVDLFVEENIESAYRSWYYERAEKIIINEFLLPVKKCAETYGKRVSFDIGKIETQYDLAEKFVNPFRLVEEGLSLSMRWGKENSSEAKAMVLSMSDESLNILAEECFDESLENKTSEENILLIKPSRGVMERYVRRKKKKYRTETPAIVAAMDGTYYTSMLFEKGFNFNQTDEFGVEKYGTVEDGKIKLGDREYNRILICDSCRFSDKGMEILTNAEKSGVKINDKDLMSILWSEAEE